jgi:hypothetical protein
MRRFSTSFHGGTAVRYLHMTTVSPFNAAAIAIALPVAPHAAAANGVFPLNESNQF